MKAAILNDSRKGDSVAEVARETVLNELKKAGWTTHDIFLPAGANELQDFLS